MAISALFNSSNNQSLIDLFKQRQSSLKDLEKSVESGNLSQAQKDLQTLQQSTQSLKSIEVGTSGSVSLTQASGGVRENIDAQSPSGPPAGNPQTATIRNDLTAVFSAVQSGNLSEAQKALTQFEKDKAQLEATAPKQGHSQGAPTTHVLTTTSGNVGYDPDHDGDKDSKTSPDTDKLKGFANSLDTLIGALANGDTKTAQNITSVLQNTLSDLQDAAKQSSNASGTKENSALSGFIKDLQALVTAAGSGNLASATSAAQNVLKDIAKAEGNQSDTNAPANTNPSIAVQSQDVAQAQAAAANVQATSGNTQTHGHHHHHHSGGGASASTQQDALTALITGDSANTKSTTTAQGTGVNAGTSPVKDTSKATPTIRQ